MSTEYSDRKIKEIMTKLNGQGKLAEQAINTLTQRDPQFLLSLVHPYLNGIILHAIERSRKSSGLKEPKPAAPLPKRAATPKSTAPKPEFSGNAVDSLMKAWAKGFEQDTPPKPGAAKVSQSHIDVMQSLVKKKK